jgi:hypothetical protein
MVVSRTRLEDLETSDNDLDEYRIRKLYRDARGDREQVHYFNMDNPTDDDRLKNLERSNLRRDEDDRDSWYVDGTDNGGEGQVRLELWARRGRKFHNCEVTAYAFYKDDLQGADDINYAFQLYCRGGHHGGSGTGRCYGACYKAGLKKDGKVKVRKEPQHPVYCDDRGSNDRVIDSDRVKRRWIGLKQVTYNFRQGGKTCVATEVWIDTDSDDDRNLRIRNGGNWRRVANVKDTGGWSWDDNDDRDREMRDFEDDCKCLDENESRERRRPEDIITRPGGTDEDDDQDGHGVRDSNLAALRCDKAKLKFRYFSVREITPPEEDSD